MRYVLVSLIVGISLGYWVGRDPDKKTQIEYRDRVVRTVVRVTNPDGTIREEINEREDRSGKSTKIENNNRKYSFDVAYAPVGQQTYQVGVGYRVFKNISVTGSYVRHKDQNLGLLGLRVDF